jgi:hypothetical protein
MLEYFSDDKYKYSIALMFSYINLCKPNKNKLNISDLIINLEYNCWEDINNKKYKDEVKRIKNANIKYPIIIDSNYNIIDGMHRYVKHILDNKKKINVYIFDKKIMKKFIIAKRNEEVKLKIHDFIELYIKRFQEC